MEADTAEAVIGRPLHLLRLCHALHFHRLDPLRLLSRHRRGASALGRGLRVDAVEIFDDDADEEVDGEKRADKHPEDGEEGGGREVIPHGGTPWFRGVHQAEHERVPAVTRRHHKQKQHRLLKGVEAAQRWIDPLYDDVERALRAAALKAAPVRHVRTVVRIEPAQSALRGGVDQVATGGALGRA